MQFLRDIINSVSNPTVMLTLIILLFFFVFPPTNWFMKWNKILRIRKIWTNTGGIILLVIMVAFYLFGIIDANFRLIVFKPDNVPIVGLIFLVLFFTWLSMKQAVENDERFEKGEQPDEKSETHENVLVWPDLVYVEFIALILCTVLLLVWSIGVAAPLEEPANPAVTPNPSKAPWYFLGLQEMLVYFDPWIAGVLFPTIIIVGLMAIPFFDFNPKGSGYYCYRERMMAISFFLFSFLVLWIFLMGVGTILRGPNWNIFGPFETWDIGKIEALSNINLSEYIYLFLFRTSLPQNIFLREMFGILLILGYFLVLPPLFAKTFLKDLYLKMGNVRYSVFMFLFLAALSLPIKMYLRWMINLKYIVAIPEFFFNI